jgi:TM2 domain-containing membrane protein YozV
LHARASWSHWPRRGVPGGVDAIEFERVATTLDTSLREFRAMGSNTVTAGQGSAGNVIAALCSFFVPGLGQLLQGRVLSALFWFLFACAAFGITWVITLSTLPFGWFVVSLFAASVVPRK